MVVRGIGDNRKKRRETGKRCFDKMGDTGGKKGGNIETDAMIGLTLSRVHKKWGIILFVPYILVYGLYVFDEMRVGQF